MSAGGVLGAPWHLIKRTHLADTVEIGEERRRIYVALSLATFPKLAGKSSSTVRLSCNANICVWSQAAQVCLKRDPGTAEREPLSMGDHGDNAQFILIFGQ